MAAARCQRVQAVAWGIVALGGKCVCVRGGTLDRTVHSPPLKRCAHLAGACRHPGGRPRSRVGAQGELRAPYRLGRWQHTRTEAPLVRALRLDPVASDPAFSLSACRPPASWPLFARRLPRPRPSPRPRSRLSWRRCGDDWGGNDGGGNDLAFQVPCFPKHESREDFAAGWACP